MLQQPMAHARQALHTSLPSLAQLNLLGCCCTIKRRVNSAPKRSSRGTCRRIRFQILRERGPRHFVLSNFVEVNTPRRQTVSICTRLDNFLIAALQPDNCAGVHVQGRLF